MDLPAIVRSQRRGQRRCEGQILNNIMLSGVLFLATSLLCLILDIHSQLEKQYCKRQSQCVFLCDKTGVVVDLTPFKRSDNKPV